MKPYDLKIIPDALWSEEETHKPTYYVANGHSILVKNEYLRQINKKDPRTYTWLVHEYGSHIFHENYGYKLSDIDFSFPDNRYSKFAFAYQFEYLKRHGFFDLMDLKHDRWLMHLHMHHPVIRTYFNNSSFIMSYPDR